MASCLLLGVTVFLRVAQWVAMAGDVPFLQPVNGPVVSYTIHGMSNDTPIPEFRIMANTSWNEVFRSLNEVMTGSCLGLMSNQTALDKMKVWVTCLLSVLPLGRG